MPIINAAEAARAAKAERDRLRRQRREQLFWQIHGMTAQINQLTDRRAELIEQLKEATPTIGDQT